MSDTAARARLEATKKRAEKFAIDNGWASDSDPVIADLAAFAEGERELWFEQLSAQSAAQVEEVAREILDGIRGKDCATDAEHNYVKHILRQHGYGAQPRLQIIEFREVKPSNAPDRYVVFLNNREIASFEFEHEAEALKVNLETALGAQGQGVGPHMTIGKINVDAFLKVIGIDTSKGDGLGLEWEPRYIATKAFEMCSPVPSPNLASFNAAKIAAEIGSQAPVGAVPIEGVPSTESATKEGK